MIHYSFVSFTNRYSFDLSFPKCMRCDRLRLMANQRARKHKFKVLGRSL